MSKTPTEGMPQVRGEPEGQTRPPLTDDTQQILLCHTNGLPKNLLDYLVYRWTVCGEFPQLEEIAKVMRW